MDSYLFKVAEDYNYHIYNRRTKNSKSFIVEIGNEYHINIDKRKTINHADEHVCMAHELGHCISGTTYTVYHTPLYRGSAEYRADYRAAQLLVPIDKLNDCIKWGITEKYDLAEYFAVTDEFIERVLYIYGNKGLINTTQVV